MKVAIFDFDGTLYPEETFPLMMKHLKSHTVHKKKYRSFIVKVLPVYIAYKMGLYPEQQMKEYSMRAYISAFKHCSKIEIKKFFLELGTTMQQNLSSSVLQKISMHKQNGYIVMLVSGAFTPLLEGAANDLPFDCLIGTSIPFRDGYLDESTPIMHIHGERKVDKIMAQLANKSVNWEDSYAYGDSFSDLNVLDLVGNPVAVNPEQKLLHIAKTKNWEVLL